MFCKVSKGMLRLWKLSGERKIHLCEQGEKNTKSGVIHGIKV